MTATIGHLLRGRISPESFQHLRYRKWYLQFYLPRLTASNFIRRTPKVQGFPSSRPPELLVNQIRDVNVVAPTEMCRVMTRHGSDKGNGVHNYTTIYSVLFGDLRDRPLRIFELGLGTNNPELASTMGATGYPGASLRGWRELFPNALVYGADIDRGILFEEDRIRTFYCDQLDDAAIRDLWSRPELQGGMDILIEDGLHTFEANLFFLERSLEQLRPGGIYVVEDIYYDTFELWSNQLGTVFAKRFPNHEFVLVSLPPDEEHTNLMIARRLR